MLPQSQTLILMIFMIFSNVGGIVYYFLEDNQTPLAFARYPLYLIRSIGIYGIRINTGIVGMSLLIISYGKFSFVKRTALILQIVGVIFPVFLSVMILVIVRDGFYDYYRTFDHMFGFDEEPIVATVILILCLVPTVVALVMEKRFISQRMSMWKKAMKVTDVENHGKYRRTPSDLISSTKIKE